MACPNGAESDPSFTLTTVALNAAVAGLAAVGGLPEIVPWLFESPILGQQATSSLCALNLDDPGDFQLSMLATPSGLDVLPSPTAPPGTLVRWIWDKTAYFFFQRACRCIGTGAKPPPPVVITTPPGVDTSPNQPNNADQLTRIENNQSTSSDALKTLYNGLQLVAADTRDMAFRQRQNILPVSRAYPIQMSGEGMATLSPVTFGHGSSQDVVGLVVHLSSIPPTVARRGTTYQRLYGVGSLEWSAEGSTSYPHIIAQRDALHYEYQYVQAPQSVQVFVVRWRLQPGVTAEAYQIERSSDGAIYAAVPPYDNAYMPFAGWSPPVGWTDKPFYPASATTTIRALPGGGAPP